VTGSQTVDAGLLITDVTVSSGYVIALEHWALEQLVWLSA